VAARVRKRSKRPNERADGVVLEVRVTLLFRLQRLTHTL
jgi:hypothetical protein